MPNLRSEINTPFLHHLPIQSDFIPLPSSRVSHNQHPSISSVPYPQLCSVFEGMLEDVLYSPIPSLSHINFLTIHPPCLPIQKLNVSPSEPLDHSVRHRMHPYNLPLSSAPNAILTTKDFRHFVQCFQTIFLPELLGVSLQHFLILAV